MSSAKGSKAKASSGKGKLVVILAIVMVILGAGGGAGWWFVLRPKDAQAAKRAATPKPVDAHFIQLEPFVTNVLSDDGQTHYVQVNIALKTSDVTADDGVKTFMPEIRNSILTTLGEQRAAAVANEHVQDQLRASIRQDVNRILRGDGSGDTGDGSLRGPISGVYFSGFVMQ